MFRDPSTEAAHAKRFLPIYLYAYNSTTPSDQPVITIAPVAHNCRVYHLKSGETAKFSGIIFRSSIVSIDKSRI